MYKDLLKFTLITLVVLGGLWGLRWYVLNKLQPSRPRPIIKVIERTMLAPGRQGLVVEVGQQRFFLVLSDKHSSITEIDCPDFAVTLQEEVDNADNH